MGRPRRAAAAPDRLGTPPKMPAKKPAARKGRAAASGGAGESASEPRKAGVKKVGLDAPRPKRGGGGTALASVGEAGEEAPVPRGRKKAKAEDSEESPDAAPEAATAAPATAKPAPRGRKKAKAEDSEEPADAAPEATTTGPASAKAAPVPRGRKKAKAEDSEEHADAAPEAAAKAPASAKAAPAPRGRKRAKPEADAAPEAAQAAGEGVGGAVGGGGDGPAGAKRPKRSPAEARAGGAGPKAKASGGKGQPSRDKEERLWEKGYETVAGVDEAGRGPLAGPVVAAACILPRDYDDLGINDSKKLTEEEREELYEALISDKRVLWATCVLDHRRIDEINILAATMEAMSSAVAGLKGEAKYILIDGNRCPKDMEIPCEAVVQGDAKCTSIAAASIIAKVTRDRLMKAYHDKWPQYNFAKHKGYGTADHVSAIFKHGASPIHRMTFAPLKNMKA